MIKILETIPQLGEDATVTNFALLVGKSKAVISGFKNKGVFTGKSLIDWLHSYMTHLSNVAGGRGTDNENLTAARIAELETKTALNNLTYHEKLGVLIERETAESTLIDWAIYTNQEVSAAFEKLIIEIESEYKIEIDEQLVIKNVGNTTKRIKGYAEKMAEEFGADSL